MNKILDCEKQLSKLERSLAEKSKEKEEREIIIKSQSMKIDSQLK